MGDSLAEKAIGNPIVPFASLKPMRRWLSDQGIPESRACAVFCKLHGTAACSRKGNLCELYELKASTVQQVAALSREFVSTNA